MEHACWLLALVMPGRCRSAAEREIVMILGTGQVLGAKEEETVVKAVGVLVGPEVRVSRQAAPRSTGTLIAPPQTERLFLRGEPLRLRRLTSASSLRIIHSPQYLQYHGPRGDSRRAAIPSCSGVSFG